LILKDGFYHENLGIVEENIMDLLIK